MEEAVFELSAEHGQNLHRLQRAKQAPGRRNGTDSDREQGQEAAELGGDPFWPAETHVQCQ